MDYADFSLGWQELEQPVTVSLTRRATDTEAAITVNVDYVAESEISLDDIADMDSVAGDRGAKIFTFWLTPLLVAGSLIPQTEDDVTDEDGNEWVIVDVDEKNRGQRFTCTAIAKR